MEDIFGIAADAQTKTVSVRPLLCKALRSGELSLTGVKLPDGGTLSVFIKDAEATVSTQNTAYRAIVTQPFSS